MSRILFLNHASVGHLNTLLSIALQMRDEGHEVSFLIPGDRRTPKTRISVIDTAFSLPSLIEKNGIQVAVMRPPLTSLLPAFLLPFTHGYQELRLVMNIFAGGLEHYTRAILKHLATHKPDAIVTDFAFLGSSIAAEVQNIPYATIYHSGLPFRGALIPPFGSGLPIVPENSTKGTIYDEQEQKLVQQIDHRVRTARHAFGLDDGVGDFLRHPYSPWLNLVTSVEAIEAPRDHLPANTLYIGPCFGKRKAMQTEFPYDQLRADRFKIYVSLGTVFNNKPQVFRRILAGLDQPEYQVIVSAGGSYETLARQALPANVLLFKSVPQVDLLPKVDLVIGHGGNNSTNETLAAGKPLIVLPVGGEQGDNARRVEYLRCGKYLNMKTFTPLEIQQAVEQLRHDPQIAARSAELKAAIAQADGLSTAAACVAWIAQHQKSLNRPDHMPLTITPHNIKELLK